MVLLAHGAAGDYIQPRVSLTKPVQRSVVGEGRANQHNVIKLAVEWAAQLVHKKLGLARVGRANSQRVEWNLARVHFNTSQNLSILNGELGVQDYEDVEIKRPFSCFSLDFQLDSVCGVDEAGAAAMHFLTGHRAQIDQKPELISGVVILQSHMLWFVFFFHKEAAGLPPSILAFDAVVVQHVRRAVYRH